MTVPVARTSQEAHLHMDLTPCGCGEPRFDRTGAVVTLPDGELGSRYAGHCAACGAAREFHFRLPEHSFEVPPDIEVSYGGPAPSELLDAGQWLWVADRYASTVPAGPERLAPDQQRIARARLSAAIAAIGEVLKFLPDDAEDVPSSAFWTPLGRSVYEPDPGRFRWSRLDVVRGAYEKVLRSLDRPAPPGAPQQPGTAGRPGFPPPSGRQRRLEAIDQAKRAWAERYGIDDGEWTEEGSQGPNRRSPTAEQQRELVRIIRMLSGQDPETGRPLDDGGRPGPGDGQVP